jgi:hypothetical protein
MKIAYMQPVVGHPHQTSVLHTAIVSVNEQFLLRCPSLPFDGGGGLNTRPGAPLAAVTDKRPRKTNAASARPLTSGARIARAS